MHLRAMGTITTTLWIRWSWTLCCKRLGADQDKTLERFPILHHIFQIILEIKLLIRWIIYIESYFRVALINNRSVLKSTAVMLTLQLYVMYRTPRTTAASTSTYETLGTYRSSTRPRTSRTDFFHSFFRKKKLVSRALLTAWLVSWPSPSELLRRKQNNRYAVLYFN